MKRKAIALFAGCGGDTLGLKKAGFEVVGFVENDNAAKKSLRQNFPEAELIGEEWGGNIREIPNEEFEKYKGEIDIITAGFPCQGFSHAGKKDPSDPRNELFWEFVRATKIIEPNWIIGENVSGLLRRKTEDGEAKVSEVIVSAFEDIGYTMAEPTVLEGRQFGVPQRRRRVFFVGSKSNETLDMSTLKSREKQDNPVKDLVEFNLEGAARFDPEIVEGEVKEYCESSGREEAKGEPHPYLVSKLEEEKLSFGKRVSPHHAEVVDLNSPTKTIHCGYKFQPRLFVPLKNKNGTFLRTFTVKELAQIQGFPEDFKFHGSKDEKIDQIGNAVPPQMIKGIVEKIKVKKSVKDFI